MGSHPQVRDPLPPRVFAGIVGALTLALLASMGFLALAAHALH